MKRVLILALLLVFPATALAQSTAELAERAQRAGMDQELLTNLQERAAGAGLSGAETARLMEPAVLLAEQDLPARAVVQRALEGLAKGIPPDRIHHVMERLQAATEQAGRTGDAWLQRPDVRAMLGVEVAPRRSPARGIIVESLAQALDRDVPAEALTETLDRLPAEVPPGRASASAVGAAFQILPDLPMAAQDPGLAASLLSQALNTGFATSELRRLPAALEAAGRRGQMPVEAAARGALEGMAQGTPAATILERLFQGQIPGRPPGGVPPGLERRPGGGQGGPPGRSS